MNHSSSSSSEKDDSYDEDIDAEEEKEVTSVWDNSNIPESQNSNTHFRPTTPLLSDAKEEDPLQKVVVLKKRSEIKTRVKKGRTSANGEKTTKEKDKGNYDKKEGKPTTPIIERTKTKKSPRRRKKSRRSTSDTQDGFTELLCVDSSTKPGKRNKYSSDSEIPSSKDKARRKGKLVVPLKHKKRRETDCPSSESEGESDKNTSLTNRKKKEENQQQYSHSDPKRHQSKRSRSTALDSPEQILSESNDLQRETIVGNGSPTIQIHREISRGAKKKSIFSPKRLSVKKKSLKHEQRYAATKIQSLWKGYRIRKKMAQIGPIHTPLQQLYCIQDLIKKYLSPLLEYNKTDEQARKSLPIQVIKAIFRNIQNIFNLHVSQFSQLLKRIEHWPFVSDIPLLFLQATGHYSIYYRFAEGAAAAEETLRFYKQNQPLRSFLAKVYDQRLQFAVDPTLSLPSLYSLLFLPFKHLSHVHRCYTQFMFHTPSTYQDYQLLADAVAIVNQLKNLVWNTARVGIRRREMTILTKKIEMANNNTSLTVSKPRVITLNPQQPINAETLNTSGGIERKDDDDPKKKKNEQIMDEKHSPPATSMSWIQFDLNIPNRKLIRCGSIMVGKDERYVALFNDICLILEVIEHVSRYEAVFDLHGVSVEKKSVSVQDNSQKFVVRTDRGNYIFMEHVTSNDEGTSWMQSFQEAVTLCNDEIFGVALDILVEREKSAIPSVVLNIIQYLNKNISHPCLFQRTFDSNSIQSLRDPSTHRKLNESEIGDVVGLLIFYLEQLPDVIIPYHSKDPIFAAPSTPDEATLLEWVRKKLKEMPLCSKNLLEYIVSFLSKVLARSAVNGIVSVDLAVIFSPLFFHIENLTLSYCNRMPRIVRLVKIIIERATDLFRTVDVDSTPLPVSLYDFFTTDQFGQWWRDFRQKKAYFITFITTREKIGELVDYIISIPFVESSDEQRMAAQFASLAYGVLVNDGVIHAIFKDTTLLALIINKCTSGDQNINEKAYKHFCDFIEVLLRSHPERMKSFLQKNENMNRKLLANIGSGNFCNTLLSVAETWQMSEIIHEIVVDWGIVGLTQYLKIEESPYSDTLANTVRFLRFLVRTNGFMASPASHAFLSVLSSPSYIHQMIQKSVTGNGETCVCTIPLLIEILVQNKNKNSNASPLDNIVIPVVSDRKNLTEEEKKEYLANAKEAYRLLEQQLRGDVPSVILALLESHEILEQHMNIPLKSKEHVPLGFFRFGVVKLVQAMLVTNYPYSNSFIAKTNLVDICLQLFFFYHKHSILHSVIAYIVRYIMAMGNRDLVEMLLLRLDLPGQILRVFDGSHTEQLEYLRGYLKMFGISIHGSSLGKNLLSQHKEWNRFVSTVLLQQEHASNSTTNKQVVLAQKQITRSNLTKKEFTDQLEDKIG